MSMSDSDMVEVFATCDAGEAEIVRGLLESNGVRCVVESSISTMISIVGTAAEAKILVEASDAERAKEILGEDRSSDVEDI